MDQVLRLREFESAQIGGRWDPEKREIPESFVPRLESIQAGLGAEVLSIGRRQIKAQNYVGTIGLGSRAIDILPKVDEVENARVRSTLVEMLATAGLVPTLETGEAQLAIGAPTLLDAFMAIYVRRLALEWRRGHIRDYLRLSASRPYLRGKLRFSQHIRRNLHRPDRFYTQADEFTEDVPLSQLLKLALQVCRRHAVSEEVRHAAVELLQDFGGVSDESLDSGRIESISVDRRTERFRRVVELARAIASRRTPDGEGGSPSYSLVFDMNVVFEAYVGRLLQQLAPSFGLSVDLQLGEHTLLVRNGKGRFKLRPDVGIFERGRLIALVDTKWKRLDLDKNHENVSQSDMYQMYAYGREFDSPTVVLLYPRFAGIPEKVASYRHHDGGPSARRIEVRTVDVVTETRGHLRRLLEEVRARAE